VIDQGQRVWLSIRKVCEVHCRLHGDREQVSKVDGRALLILDFDFVVWRYSASIRGFVGCNDQGAIRVRSDQLLIIRCVGGVKPTRATINADIC
jgi:hypothetical protein